MDPSLKLGIIGIETGEKVEGSGLEDLEMGTTPGTCCSKDRRVSIPSVPQGDFYPACKIRFVSVESFDQIACGGKDPDLGTHEAIRRGDNSHQAIADIPGGDVKASGKGGIVGEEAGEDFVGLAIKVLDVGTTPAPAAVMMSGWLSPLRSERTTFTPPVKSEEKG